MSLERYFALAIVAIWLVVAVFFAVSDVSILIDPVSRRLQHVCTAEIYAGHSFPSADLSERECLPRIAMRAGFDALMVVLPLMVAFALVGRRAERRSRRKRRTHALLSSSVTHAKSSRFSGK